MQAIELNRSLLVYLSVLLLAACGFQLRGAVNLPFDTIYVSNNTSVARDVKRTFKSNGVKVVDQPENAQVMLELMNEVFTKNILSLSGGGKVREYEILYKLTFRMRDASSELWGVPQVIELRRDFSYSDQYLLAKEGEEALLNADIRAEAVREVLRRTGSLSKGKAAAE